MDEELQHKLKCCFCCRPTHPRRLASPASRYYTRPRPLTLSTGCCPTPNMSSWSSPSSGARLVPPPRSSRPTPWRWAYDELLNIKDLHPSLPSKGLLRFSRRFEMCRLQVRPIGVPTEVEWRQVNESSIEIRWKHVKVADFRGPPHGYRVHTALIAT